MLKVHAAVEVQLAIAVCTGSIIASLGYRGELIMLKNLPTMLCCTA